MEYIYTLATIVYFVLGFGVWNMWRRLVDDDYSLVVIIGWPFILFITALFNRAY